MIESTLKRRVNELIILFTSLSDGLLTVKSIAVNSLRSMSPRV